ncbi:MAG: hypothetical protein CMO55_21595 [Verrucomicrobiales bacterium]|nr:hypothetical protein [Verrucomicrobiales bacterium]
MIKSSTTLVLIGLLAGSLAPSAATAAPGKKSKTVMRDAATHNELSNKLRMAQQKDPIRDLGPAIGKTEEDPAAKFAGRDLVKDSAIICYRGYLTLVPKKSVLHTPDHLKDRFGEKPNIKIVRWPDFFQANRGWIRTMEVTKDQVMGNAPLPESTLEAIQKSSSLIIATFNGGPVSVLPYEPPSEDEATNTTEGNTNQE